MCKCAMYKRKECVYLTSSSRTMSVHSTTCISVCVCNCLWFERLVLCDELGAYFRSRSHRTKHSIWLMSRMCLGKTENTKYTYTNYLYMPIREESMVLCLHVVNGRDRQIDRHVFVVFFFFCVLPNSVGADKSDVGMMRFFIAARARREVHCQVHDERWVVWPEQPKKEANFCTQDNCMYERVHRIIWNSISSIDH